MIPNRTRAALAPVLSSPTWLCVAGFFVTLGVYLIQVASGISPWRETAPIELSSNVVAAMAAVWCAIQLRTHWRSAPPRKSWMLLFAAMGVLSLEDSVGDWLTLETQSLYEMSISIVLWMIAAIMIRSGCRRYLSRRYVAEFVIIGFALQIVSQGLGLAAAIGVGTPAQIDSLKILNDTGELVSVLAYLFAMFFAEFATVKSIGFGALLATDAPAASSRPPEPRCGEVIEFARFRGGDCED